MFSISLLGLLLMASFSAMVLVFSFLLDYRNTLRGFREFFDLRLLRRHYYSVVGTKRGFWFVFGAVSGSLLALAAWLVVEPDIAAGACGTAFGVYLILAGGSTTYLFFADALSFGPGPRRDHGNGSLGTPDGGPRCFPNVCRLGKGKPPVRDGRQASSP
ncbi:MAG: hypothetical protein U1E05_07355 [Patescibacteria group bacterium]|nr:hypothetical protein [Patescibacteria group bacterium]